MNKKSKEISEAVKKCIGFTFEVLVAFLNVLVTVLIMTGSIASLVILYKLYPQMFIMLSTAISPVVIMMITIIKFLVGLLIALVVGYLLFNLAIFMIKVSKESRDRQDKKREEFLDDLTTKITKKLKKK